MTTPSPFSGNGVLQSSHKHDWETPQWLYDQLDRVFGFNLDAAADPDTAKCAHYYTPQADALSLPWLGRVWLNPPYGRTLSKWMQKAHHEATIGKADLVVCLIPARPDTAWWHDYVQHGAIWLLRGRLRFGDASNSAPFPSAVVMFRKWSIPRVKHWDPKAEAFPL